ncbi:UPF0488 protein CG14286 [Anopheles maculipalpis]|uniref:UPF0488 protein CG14286 n=1 Tax=Anopheles maculipalpis TaxID=1496333 RepID=UPI002158F720|nr:UPF0488 protein CG14286 [Anopheles maculipalpis]
MAPPKIKLHKNTGKLKSIPRPTSSIPTPAAPASNASGAGSGSGSNVSAPSEADRQFELELYWCIQQLETTLNLPSVRENNKKVEETSKLINTLKSGTQPIIRKRQIMRTTFGDYRSKMAAEEQTMAVNPDSVRFDKPKETTTKHTFVKKSAVLNGDKNFKFNFSVDVNEPEQQLEVKASGVDKKQDNVKTVRKTNVGIIVPSDNQFRFNFNVSSD